MQLSHRFSCCCFSAPPGGNVEHQAAHSPEDMVAIRFDQTLAALSLSAVSWGPVYEPWTVPLIYVQ